MDYIAAIEIMNAIRSANGFAFAIVLNPFSFEGKKRQDEASDPCYLSIIDRYMTDSFSIKSICI